MSILERSIQDSPDSITRFLILEPTDTPTNADRIYKLFIVVDCAGAQLRELVAIIEKMTTRSLF